jgi:NAD(P)-dependent dehydrogenase (short-subunit alcohol dehydrogenase family)
MAVRTSDPGRVLITGGASGLGAAVAAAVASAGGTPIVLDRVAGAGVGREYRVDVSVRSEVERVVAQAAADAGGLDAVVTAAGIDRPGDLDEITADDWELVLGVNLLGTVSVVRAALPALLLTHGHVVTVASSLGLKAVGGATAYCASKFGVIGFTRSLAAETRGRLDVTTVIPAGMKTRFFDDRAEQYKPRDDSRLNDPANVADAILFALAQPPGSVIRELAIMHELEESWP